MGGAGSKEDEAAVTSRKMNSMINAQNRRDQEKDRRKIKLLLLGTGESGKSTIVKQVRKLYGNEMTEDEKKNWRPMVFENINKQILAIIEASETLKLPLNPELVAPLKDLDPSGSTPLTQKTAADILTFWKDKETREVWDRRYQYQVLDCIEYYVNELNRIADPKYVPSFQDIIQARVRTTGIVTEKFTMEGIPFELYDVGGQRNERKKWIACFDNVTTVIFVAAINEYDQKLFEDGNVDRIEESLNVFDQIVNNPVFKDISFVIFMNKFDLFEQKLFQYPYRVESGPTARNVDFKGPYAEDIKEDSPEQRKACIEAAAKHMRSRFEARAHDRTGIGAIQYHHTNATDSKNMGYVFNACKDHILRLNLTKSGFAHV